MISKNEILLIFTSVPHETLNFPSGSEGKLISHKITQSSRKIEFFEENYIYQYFLKL